jgi:hypothetical protein
MEVLFDLQQELEALDLNASLLIVPIGDIHPTLAMSVVDDVKTILVKDRAEQMAGLGVMLRELPDIREGDRITVTGRVPRESPMGSWGVALVIEETETRHAEECQLAQSASPKSLFSLSHILNGADLQSLITVQTTRWGAINPIMDFYVDSILISRNKDEHSITEDRRSIVYSFDTDEKLQPGGAISSADFEPTEATVRSNFLAQSGNPDIKIFIHEDDKAIYVSGRNKDWDGVDIYMDRLGLIAGNKYQITVTGKMDGHVPDDTIITLQGIPGYSWRNNQNMQSDQSFTLTHTLNHAEVDQWTTVRITTNAAGATVPFYIYGIEIKRLGLL